MDNKILRQQIIELLYNNLDKNGMVIEEFNKIVDETFDFIITKIKRS